MIKFTIGADTADFDKGVKSSEQRLDELQKKMRGGINTAGKWGAGMASAAMAMGAAMVAQGAKAVSAQVDLQRALGGSYDAITALKMAANDMGLDGVEASLTRMNRRLGAAEKGGGAAAGAVKELGLDLKALSKLDADEKIAHISSRMREMNVTSERAARIAQDLGFEQTQAARFFMEAGESMSGYRSEVDALGMSISDLDAMRVANANDSIAKMGEIMASIGKAMAVHVAPVVEALGKMFVDTAKEAGGIGSAVEKGAAMATKAMSFVFDASEGLKRAFELAGKAIVVALLTVQGAALRLADHIINGPTNALNGLINMANKIPGVDIENAGLTGFGATVQAQADLARDALQFAIEDMQETLMEPITAGDSFKTFVADAKSASDEAAQAAIDAQDKMREAFGGGESGGESEEVKAKKKALEEKLEAIREANLTEMELLLEKQELEREAIAEGRELLLEQGINFDQLEADMHERQQQAITDIEERQAEERMRQAKREADYKKSILMDSMNALTTLMNSGSRKMFEVGKAAAIAQAMVSTFTGAAKALELGFPLGPIAAAGMVAAGMVQVANIKKQTMGGTSGGGAAPRVSTPTQSVNASNQPVQAQENNMNMYVRGINPNDMFSGQQMVDMINSAQENGAVLRVG